MRITSQMVVANSLRRLSSRLERYEQAQSRLATGQRMLTPSDDPAGAGRALSLRATQRSRQQEARNAADAHNLLALADSQLQAGVERLHRVRELAVRGASTLDATERAALAEEIRTVQDELVSIANARHRDRPLFAGYRDVAAVAKVDGTWTYQGDDGVVTRRVGEQDLVPVSVTAGEVFGFGAAGGDLFTLLDDVVAALTAGDADALSAHLGGIDTARQRINDAQARIGASANWVESAQRRTQDALLAIRGQLAQVEDVDIAEAIMDLQTQEVAYEATLQGLARALPPTLASFLR